ncbi:lactoperoxidase-like isoform X2 [Homarus americanus]|uniref:lactoperoxidase-like isoform X2 n=1 Tax=Homarus americanus TaxID=6706 RepID=UPI001C452A0E|nr:lactoperoxidase-like isoform X2 [Homarus americanus]
MRIVSAMIHHALLLASMWTWAYAAKVDSCALQIVRGVKRHTSHRQALFTNVVNVPLPGTVCITYADVEAALFTASSRIAVNPSKGEIMPEEIAPIGEMLLEASSILATQYGLTASELFHNLPLVDMTKTSATKVCPRFALPMTCTPGKFRRYDGLCNNLHSPTWGAINSVFSRFLPPDYSDGIGSPRLARDGHQLPNPRIVSSMIHRDDGFHDHAATLLLVSWGQLMDHDFTLTATPLDPRNKNEIEECCNRPPALKNPYCFEINIPHDDPFYRLFKFTCIDFARGFPGVQQNCRLGPRTQFNLLTSVIDGNTVYGGNERAARELRSGVGGLMRTHDGFPGMPLKSLLPLKTDIPDEGCIRGSGSQRCFLAGEIRVNEQLILTCSHILLMREHNRLAMDLGSLNPHWDDERLYQEVRRIIAAQIQHITYNEFLPQLLGREVMEQFGLLLQKEGYWDGYDPKVDPGISSSFSAAAFRFGHSLLPSSVERWSPSHKFIASRRLHELIRQPYDLHRPGVLDEYIMGMLNQPSQAMDDGITQEVTNHLFREEHEKFGFDLVAFNIQRGREFGVPGYGAWRRYCGLEPILSFQALTHLMSNNTASLYASIYRSVDDIDLWSAGVSERPLPGSLLGPIFSCIIATQMQRLRQGDRYWYELPGQPSSFTLAQLESLRKVRLARLICDNADNIETLQVYPMVLQDPRINPRVSCKSGVIPRMDLRPWAEHPKSSIPRQHVLARNSVVPGIPRSAQSFFSAIGLLH